MTVFMYAAAFHCEECGDEIRKSLSRDTAKKMIETLNLNFGKSLIATDPDKNGPCKQFMFDLEDQVAEFIDQQGMDSDDWPISYPDAGESDCPQNCDSCHKPLEYSLTNDGIAYVVEHVREQLKAGREAYCKIHPSHDPDSDYYVNSPAFRVVADWVEDMRYYHLEGKAARIFRMVEWMERVYEQTREKADAK